MPVFQQAAADYNVPVDILLALGEMGSRFEDRGDSPSIANGFGVMDLMDNQWGQPLVLASGLTGTDIQQVKVDPIANIRGAAAVLDEYARQENIPTRLLVEDWLGVLIRYASLDTDSSRIFARGVYQRIQYGFDITNTRGERFTLQPQFVNIDLDSLIPSSVQLQVAPTDCGNPDYAGAIWDPAPTCNYSTSNSTKDTIVVHVAEGSAAATLNWFKNCDSGVASQYVLDSYGGVWQMVCEKHIGYHAVCYNSRSVGLEHEGHSADPSFPEAMYQASANLVRDVCNRWGIPKVKVRQGPGVLGHRDVTECATCGSHTDPGVGWDWGHYLALINQTSEPFSFIVESRSGGQNNANYSDTGFSGNSTAKSLLWDLTSGIGSRYGYMTGSAEATYRFTPSTTGTYAVYATWPYSTNTTSQLEHIVTHAGGSTSVVMDTNGSTYPCGYNNWNSLGEFTLNAGTQYTVKQTSQNHADQLVIRADAVKWELVYGTPGNDPPTITQHPSNQTVATGGTATFTVAATGSTPLSYQWQKNSSNLTDGGHYSGATTATLTVSSCDSNDAAGYRCVVTNAYGSATSNPATLTLSTQQTTYIVESASGGQNYANYSETGGWSSTTGKSTAEGCTAGIGHRFCTITSTGTPTATFRFTPSVGGTYEVFTTNCTTSNSGNPLIHKVTHTGGTTNVSVCQNTTCGNNAVNRWYSLGQYTLNSGTQYSVTLDGSTGAGSSPSGNAGRSDAIKWVSVSTSQGPTITLQPSSQSVNEGATVSFTVAASGDPPLSYQWQKNGSNLTNGGRVSGATTTTLQITSVVTGDSGDYRCVVSNAGGSTNSSAATLTVNSSAPPGEFRAFWTDIWGVGFKSATEIDDMVSRAVQGHYNVILAEVMGYHDNRYAAHGAYWNSNIVPKAPDISGGIDPLAYMCQQAHAQGIQVHAWLVPYRACDTWPPLGNNTLSNHSEYFTVPRANLNGGPVAFGSPAAYYLDPGSPDVQEYLLSIVRELVTNYPIDGIHFDVIRYMQQDAGYPARSSYTNSSLERFKRITGRTDTPPATGDNAWDDFRRRGITELVRRCRAEIPTLVNPRQPVRLSAALITWGDAPATFQGSSSWTLFQNWEEWQRLGFLDTAVPMTYYSDSSYPTWYRNWVDKEMTWRYSRHMVVGPGIYLNTFAQSLAQMQYARSRNADGLSTYSYRVTRSDSGSVWDWYPYIASNLFTDVVSPPTMPWRNSATATEGSLWGRVTDAATGNPLDDASVQVGSMTAVKTDANGYYVVTLISASGSGTNYTVSASKTGYPTSARTVQVVAGDVGRADFNLGAGNNPPIIIQQPSNVTAAPSATAIFTVQAAGSDPLTYQWQKNSSNVTNGGNISGATSTTLQVSNVSTADQANYRCVVTNAYGNATSSAASLTISTQQTTFIVESVSGGQNFDHYSETGSWSTSTAKSNAAGCTSGISSRYCVIGSSTATAAFSFTPTVTGTYEVFTTNCSTTNSGNPLIHKVAHAGGTATVQVCQNTTCSPNACNVWLSLGQFTLNGGTAYTVTLDGSTVAGSSPSGNAGRADAIKWVSVGAQPQPPTITQHPSNQNVCPNATATFTVTATGDAPLTYQWAKNGSNITNGGHYSGCTTTTLTVSNCDSNDATNYRCVVTNGAGNATSNAAPLTLKAATTITGQPQSQSVTAGANVSFSVAATGEGTLTYQWQKGGSNITNGGRVTGTTSATLQISSVATGDAGDYRCVVTAGCGSANSNAATLTVNQTPTQPGDFDHDADVDQEDFGVLQRCLAIPNPSGDPSCGFADMNGDNIINGQDVGLFKGCMSGSNVAANANCTSGL